MHAGTGEQATTGSAFDPGNIISDAVFYNTYAMTVDQIRTFLLSEGEGCTGAYCLKNLRIDHRASRPTRTARRTRAGSTRTPRR